MSRPTTVPILVTSASTSNLTLNYNAIKSILNKVGDKPLCIISINGKFRKGKSLMLNFVLQYLRARISQNNPDPENWFRPSEVGRDFNWRGGSEAETNGISIYSEPFDINVNGESIAVLLMDTQGSFDDHTSFQHNAVIFALSSLLSSVMIMNIEIGISEDMLQFLQFFSGFAQLALRNEEDDASNLSLFAQSLIFLVRDFQWIEEFRLGMHDDKSPRPNYKKVKLDPSQDKSTEANFLREQIREMFPRVAANLLPHPGNGLARDSRLDRLDPEFEEEVIRFVENIFSSQNIVKKTISGEVMTGNKLQPFVQRWQAVFENDTPTVKNLTEATAEVQNVIALANADKHFDLKMKEFSVEHPNGVSVEIFNAKTESLKIECFAVFKQTKKFGGKTYDDKYSQELNKLLETKTEYFRQLNSERMQAAEIARNLQKEREELAEKYYGTVAEFQKLKERSDAEIGAVRGQLNAVTQEMNRSLEDNRELREQHRNLDSQLQNMRTNADRERRDYEERTRQMMTKMEEQTRNHQQQVEELQRSIKKKSKRGGGFGSILGSALSLVTFGVADVISDRIKKSLK